ncbi:YdcF family protein [Entomospira culicis]|uniref:YdcF family protein n=1 Tax=Entomospira culicis TaxID=2719989 RepID=A0A968GGW2_9SPIO|nr:YdcF family protein [Entomospira culicis]NIZ19639.1 YdcF family protein [Entomospira culicis]NIZ69853.1 YdcF family protein [Entomospira culicis]WDI36960.1 YdcF family protein [Entomospira culicis]WDI38589.1 YdcF family protein [Entomospira culicis]
MKKRHMMLLIWGIFAMLGCQRAGNESGALAIGVDTTESFSISFFEHLKKANQGDTLSLRIARLEELFIYYYLHHNTLSKEESVEYQREILQLLDAINPQDASYLMGLGYLSATQGDLAESIAYYEKAYQVNGISDALMNWALYARLASDGVSYQRAYAQIQVSTKRVLFDIMSEAIDKRGEIRINMNVESLPEIDNIFILLGFELNPDGTMKPTLIERLKVALLALERYPQSQIILTGGVERNGQTEGRLMAQWLMEHGIEQDRLIEENMARDTVENLLFSLKILESQPHIKNVTIISSATHLKRAVTLFKVGNEIFKDRLEQPELFHVHNLGWQDISMEELLAHDEHYAITRDVLRMAGMWAYPRISR